MNGSGIIVLGVIVVVGIIALILLKIRWNKKAAKEWADREAARQEPPKQ
jgi:hypothetical protein